MPPLVSVIIPAHNEADQIAQCLESVFATGYPSLEVIVVDDDSTDSTAEVASRYPAKLIRRAFKGGISIARNEGLMQAQGEIVAFVDADCEVSLDWLTRLVPHYADQNVAGAGGVIGTREQGLVARYRTYREREEYSDKPDPVQTLFLPGANSTYRTAVLRDMRGFAPEFARPKGHEQFELGLRIRKKGYYLVGDPRAVVWHGREGDLKAWLGLAFRLGYSAVPFLFQRKLSDFPALRWLLITVLAFAVLIFSTALGLTPLIYLELLVVVFVFLEISRATYYSLSVAYHYRSPKYLAMLPAEVGLRFSHLIGFFVGLLSKPFQMSDTMSSPMREKA
jgi:glycosyltransferase involved in cell wall biosynthesis